MPTKEQLAKILVPDQKKYNLVVRFDKEKASFCLKNIDMIMDHLDSSTAAKNKDALLPFLKYVRQYAKPHGNKVIFSTERKTREVGGWGRLTPDKGRGYVAVTRTVRHFLAYNIYSDHDIVNCHPVIVRQLFKMYKMDDAIKLIDNWNEHREAIFEDLANASDLDQKPTRDECKKIAFCFLYDGDIDYNFKKLGIDIPTDQSPERIRKIYHLAKNICNQTKSLRDYIKEDFPSTWDSLPWDHKKGNDRKEAGKFSAMMQHIERAIMLIAASVAIDFGYEVGDYCHDGLFLSEGGSPADVSDDFYDAVNQKVNQELGFDVHMCGKEMHIDDIFQQFQDMSDGLPEPFDQAKVNNFLEDLFNKPLIDLNKLKDVHFSIDKWREKEKRAIIDAVLQKYVVRITDKWFFINISTGLWNHDKPLNKDAFNNMTAGTILQGEYSNAHIPIYDKMVFKDPQKVAPGEFNTYYHELLYDRNNSTSLTTDEILLIQPFINHIFEIVCREDIDSYNYMLHLLKNKFLKPFEVNNNSRCIVLFGPEGAGKTSWMTELFCRAFGHEFVSQQTSFKNATSADGFTNALEHKLVAIYNDVPEYDHNHSGMFENFKSMITDEYRRSHQKFMGECSVINTIMHVGSTNNRNAFKISQNDRRYFILDVSGKRIIARDPEENLKYHRDLIQCIKDHWQLIIRYILSEAKAAAQIPQTAARQHAQALSKCAVGQWLESYHELFDFKPDWEGKIMQTYYDYKVWCQNEGRRALCKTKFIGRLADKYYITVKNVPDSRKKILVFIDFDEFQKSVL